MYFKVKDELDMVKGRKNMFLKKNSVRDVIVTLTLDL